MKRIFSMHRYNTPFRNCGDKRLEALTVFVATFSLKIIFLRAQEIKMLKVTSKNVLTFNMQLN